MAEIKQILVPVSDMDRAVAFYSGHFGFRLKFRDGDRYAAFDGGGITLALTAQGESLASSVTFSVQCDDVDAFLAEETCAGVQVLEPVQQGPHERRAVLADADGNPIVVYSKAG
ncbi:VOC family protein [Pseudogemmobacter sonorensis]|uniref:VOC family protein n=1 Tax=Pseudogemmobacter sonorensis TaxID=2989681 RepID=UPI0036C0F6E4